MEYLVQIIGNVDNVVNQNANQAPNGEFNYQKNTITHKTGDNISNSSNTIYNQVMVGLLIIMGSESSIITPSFIIELIIYMISNNQGYHQSQSLRRCGLHAVNNLLQKEAYTTSDFTAISNELSQISHQSHESILTLGNYDYNILERALSLKGYSLKWHDNR